MFKLDRGIEIASYRVYVIALVSSRSLLPRTCGIYCPRLLRRGSSHRIGEFLENGKYKMRRPVTNESSYDPGGVVHVRLWFLFSLNRNNGQQL